MTGIDLCRVLKADPEFARTPIVIVGPPGAEESARGAGADATLPLPLDPKAFFAAPAPLPPDPAARGGALGGRVVGHLLARRHAARRHDPRPFARRLLRPHGRAPARRRAARRVLRRARATRRRDDRGRGHRRPPRTRSRDRGLGCRFFQLSAASRAEPRGVPADSRLGRRHFDFLTITSPTPRAKNPAPPAAERARVRGSRPYRPDARSTSSIPASLATSIERSSR